MTWGLGSTGRGAPGDSLLVEWVALVRDLAEELTTTVDTAGIGRAVSSQIRRGLGASAVVLGVLSDDGQGVAALVADGVTDATKELLTKTVPVGEALPAMAALAKGGPLLWSSLAVRDRDYPQYAGRQAASEAWAVLPLVMRGRPIGALSIGWPARHHFERAEVIILEVIAHQCALAIDRARSEEVRRAERLTLELLSEGTQLMVSALEPDRLLDALVHLAVPRLAPWCAVYGAEGAELRLIAIGVDGEEEVAARVRGRAVTRIDGPSPVAVAFRTGAVQLAHPVDEQFLHALFDVPGSPRAGEARSVAWTGLAVPIKASGDVLGVLSLASDRWERQPPDGVRFAAEELAVRVGMALANAWRFEEEQRTAVTLAEAFLPARLPSIPGYEVAARYLPAGSRVAGDWYDVASLPCGYLVGIGDAGGHGVEASSLMGQLRNGARSLAIIGKRPAEIIDGLRLITAHEHEDAFATVSYGLLDHTRHTVSWAVAGHVPLLCVGRGEAFFAGDHVGLPLGCPAPPSDERPMTFAENQGVVLVTDGVVERRACGLEEGMAQLRDLVAAHSALSADELTDTIIETLCQSPEDDCCVLVLRRT